ncbi:MAG: hypothetical protein AAF192_07075 [Pseudomonadota bacterium]
MSLRLRRADWLEIGLAQLKVEGEAGLTLDGLCGVAGKTRGSFYHHFRDLDAFADALIGYWVERDTAAPLRALEALPDAARSEAATATALRVDGPLDLAVRLFARNRPKLQRQVAAADAARLRFMAQDWRRRLGVSAATARAVAELEYASFLGSHLAFPERSVQERGAMADLFEALLRRKTL